MYANFDQGWEMLTTVGEMLAKRLAIVTKRFEVWSDEKLHKSSRSRNILRYQRLIEKYIKIGFV